MNITKQNAARTDWASNHGEGGQLSEGSFVVGKDILELLSSSMYVNPLTIYREYIQNAADAIDEAVAAGKLGNISEGRIDIVLDHIERRVVVRDNGIGLPEDEFVKRMASIGASRKRGTEARGFRGVGRLAGLGYCKELLFRSRSRKSDRVLEVRWDCRLLKGLLSAADFEGDLDELIRKIVSVRKIEDGDYPEHFFDVEIVSPRRIGNDRLLNELEINSYLSEVAPCPLNPEFKFAEQIKSILAPLGAASRVYNIFLNESDTPIYRPYSNKIIYSDDRAGYADRISEISINSIEGEPAAIGWVLHHDYQGAIPSALGVKGLRARVGNVQIGSDRIFSNIFPEERFCSWTIGEVHLVDQKILPNGRRDDFETNIHIENVITHLTPYGSEIARQCRSNSQIRNRRKEIELGEQKIQQKMDIIEQGAISKRDTDNLRRDIGTHLSEVKHAAKFDLFESKERKEMKGRVAEIERQVDGLSNQSTPDNPLLALPKYKQASYREIIGLIYECSASEINAKSLVDKMLSRISKS